MTAAQRAKELNKLPKAKLAQMHASNGGLMGVATYLTWRKDELVTALLEDEGLDSWN